MNSHPKDPPAPPGQTIVIERRERAGCLRRLAWPVVLLVGFIAYRSFQGIGPERLPEEYVAGDVVSEDRVAIVRIDGVIALDSVDHAVQQIRQARADESVKAVVLRVESPGGTVTGSDQIWREVALLKAAGKPVVVSMGGIAASGGYYLAAEADRIIAEPTTTTGSIGVIIELPNVTELMEKIGVEFHAIHAGEYKDMGSPFDPLTESERARFQELVDATYDRFLRVVARGRGLSLEQARSVAEGRIFSADEALANGLVDQLGYLEDAILEATRRAGLSDPHVFRYEEPASLTGALLGMTAPNRGFSIDEKTLMELRTPRMMMIMR